MKREINELVLRKTSTLQCVFCIFKFVFSSSSSDRRASCARHQALMILSAAQTTQKSAVSGLSLSMLSSQCRVSLQASG